MTKLKFGWVPCKVPHCTSMTDNIATHLCTYHFGRAPRTVKNDLQRGLQKKGTDLKPLITQVIDYWKTREAKLHSDKV